MKPFLWRLLSFLLALLLLAFAFLHWHRPDVQPVALPATQPASGAALEYAKAFAALPELTAPEMELLARFALHSRPAPPPEAAADIQALLAKADASLNALARATAFSECEWGFDLTLWPPQVLHDDRLSREMVLAQLVALRARDHLAHGNPEPCIDDLCLLFRFARHLAQPCHLAMGNVVALNIDHLALRIAAQHVQAFEPATLQKLSEGLRMPFPPLRPAIALDLKTYEAFLHSALIQAMKNPSNEVEVTNEQGEKVMVTDLMLVNIHFSPTFCNFLLQRYERQARELERLLDLPYPEGKLQLDAFIRKIEAHSWDMLAYGLAPLRHARHRELQVETFRAITRAVVDARLQNHLCTLDDARVLLAPFRDPFDDRPIAAEEIKEDTKNGLKLRLKSLKTQDENSRPMTLTIGLPVEKM